MQSRRRLEAEDFDDVLYRLKMNRTKLTIVGLAALVLLVGLIMFLSNVFVVKENEYRVIRQFGEIIKIIDKPGLAGKIPIIQTDTSLPKHQNVFDNLPTEVTTKDKKRIIVDNYVVWRITNPKDLIVNARTISGVERRLSETVSSVTRAELGQLDYSSIVNEKQTARGSLNEEVTKRVDEVLKRDKFGIEILDVRIKRTDLPEQNEASVYSRMISERNSKAQEYISIGVAESTKIKASTDKNVTEMLARADAKAKTIVADGEAQAAAIYNNAYNQDPAFYSMYRTLESYKTTMKGEPVIVMPIDSPYAKYLQGSK